MLFWDVMGAEQSTIKEAGAQRHGFHVLRVDEGSPAATAGLVAFFDYIVSVNGVEVLAEEPNVVREMARNHVDRPMRVEVYNARTDATRTVTIVPSNAWGGATLLGANIRYALVTGARDRVWHVLDVALDSPGHKAGLIPHKDWIIGSPQIALNEDDAFRMLIIQNRGKPVRLLVYNADSDAVREVSVVPDLEWGGNGALGVDVGSGALHRIPDRVSSPAGPSSVPAAVLSADDL